MKKYTAFLVIIAAIYSCTDTNKNKKQQEKISLDVAYTSYEEKSEECNAKEKRGCAILKVRYPVLKSANNDSLNRSLNAVNKSIYSLFSKVFIEFIPEGNLNLDEKEERLIGSFFKKHKKDQSEFEELIGYELMNNLEVAYYTNDFVSIDQTIMTYAGGAHPNTEIRYKTLDLQSGKEIETYNLLSDTVTLKAIILANIKEKMKIEPSTNLEEKGFLINDSELYISNQILIEADSVSFMYNSYDIAPYSYGNFNIKLAKGAVKMTI
tara:strand:- start:158 stop:955 length:798 start_codon:yes stop_codon:yes gene_type:complete